MESDNNTVLLFEGWISPYSTEQKYCASCSHISIEEAPDDFVIIDGIICNNETVCLNSKWYYDGIGGHAIGEPQHFLLTNSKLYVKNILSAYILGLCTKSKFADYVDK